MMYDRPFPLHVRMYMSDRSCAKSSQGPAAPLRYATKFFANSAVTGLHSSSPALRIYAADAVEAFQRAEVARTTVRNAFMRLLLLWLTGLCITGLLEQRCRAG